ncbi:hypothetical protein [Phyllobacterium endophyticum]|uniref:hypothetical protein n=1 Tax=Phyllobacterium endophyticum TaxID=1149773 RepID=UPI001846204A|nr:hypothetical protein [Phyllobacterium endophyticum]
MGEAGAAALGWNGAGRCNVVPGRITDLGGIPRQFQHMIDIVPSALAATGVAELEMINGIKQQPGEGTNIMYAWDKANADAPTRHTPQCLRCSGFCAKGPLSTLGDLRAWEHHRVAVGSLKALADPKAGLLSDEFNQTQVVMSRRRSRSIPSRCAIQIEWLRPAAIVRTSPTVSA